MTQSPRFIQDQFIIIIKWIADVKTLLVCLDISARSFSQVPDGNIASHPTLIGKRYYVIIIYIFYETTQRHLHYLHGTDNKTHWQQNTYL